MSSESVMVFLKVGERLNSPLPGGEAKPPGESALVEMRDTSSDFEIGVCIIRLHTPYLASSLCTFSAELDLFGLVGKTKKKNKVF
jgi:hypothetical protein